MACFKYFKEPVVSGGKINDEEPKVEETTLDGTVDRHGNPSIRKRSGNWTVGNLVLVNQALATMAFFGVAVNLVLFLTRVLGQDNASAANNVSKWTGTVYLFSLVGAFLSDSYWGRFKSCAIFQAVYTMGLILLSLSSYLFLLKPTGCGDEETPCESHSTVRVALFYASVYMVAFGYGGYQPNIATLGADQFDEEHPKEARSKVVFFSYFYLAMNIGQIFSNTIVGYFEDQGKWVLGFSISATSAALALVLFLAGLGRFRHFRPGGNPFLRFFKVIVAAARKWNVKPVAKGGVVELHEFDAETYSKNGCRRMFHTKGFKFLDKAAVVPENTVSNENQSKEQYDPWFLCTVTQVEEVKCVVRLLPIWLCSIMYSVVFTQMASVFVEQGAAMKTVVSGFHIPAASMTIFDIASLALFILLNRHVIDRALLKRRNKPLSELERMGIGLVFAVLAMVSAGTVEVYRLRYAARDCKGCVNHSSLSIFWQVPQYVFIGASEVFSYVGQLEFFNGQAPDGLKSFGSALCFTSMSLGNYVSSLLVTVVMKVTASGGKEGWIPSNLNVGRLDGWFFLLAGLTAIDLVAYVFCSRSYKYVNFEGSLKGEQMVLDKDQGHAEAV